MMSSEKQKVRNKLISHAESTAS